MFTKAYLIAIIAVCILFAQTDSNYTTITGSIGESGQWGSGWIDLENVMTFNKGTVLRIEVGGTAQKVIVRLLGKGKTPDMPVGILGRFDVPENRVIEVILKSNYTNIWQISVHGSPKAWNYNLGAENGPATIVNIEFKTIESISSINNNTEKSDKVDFLNISGTPGESGQWGSGWIDLENVMTFNKGTLLRIEVGGTAQKILIRLLEKGKTPDMPVGILGKFDVPENRVIEVTLKRNYTNIWQISIHGSPKAWNYNLGAENGPATIGLVQYK